VIEAKADPCRFCRLYALSVVAFAALIGVVMAAQMGFGLRKFGGFEYIMPVIALSSVRSLAPGVTGSALLVAFVVWAHPLRLPELQSDLPRLLKRALLVTLPGFVAAVLVALGSGLVFAHLGLGVSWHAAQAALASLTRADWAVGALSALIDAGLIVFLAWRYLPRLQAAGSSLPMKLVLAWTFGTGLRMTVGLLGSLLLSG
jgi:Permease MlaE